MKLFVHFFRLFASYYGPVMAILLCKSDNFFRFAQEKRVFLQLYVKFNITI